MQTRRGFTLIEILVVVTIIAILMTLTLQVVGGLIDNSRDAATKATIGKLQGLINQRAQGLDRLILRKGFLTGCFEYAAIKADYPAIPKSTQDVMTKKMLEVKYFPQRPTDMYDTGLYPASANLSSADSGELLFYFLTQTTVSDSPVGTDAFSSSEVRDTNANNLPEFIDAWGTPLRFYRWPTRFFRSGGQNMAHSVANISQQDIANARSLFSTLPIFSGNLASDLARDPGDPLQDCLFGFTNFETTPIQMYFMPAVGANTPKTPILMHTPATFHVYLIVSAGPDKTFGMYDPADVANFGYLGAVKDQEALRDDIISLNIRAGGK